MRIKLDTKATSAFAKTLALISTDEQKKLMRERAVKQLAAVYIRQAVMATPVGQERERTVNIKGQDVTFRTDSQHMRRSWRIGKAIRHTQTASEVLVSNTATYATFVDQGHRQTPGRYVPILGKRLVANWVEGLHITDKAKATMERNAEKIINASVMAMFKKG